MRTLVWLFRAAVFFTLFARQGFIVLAAFGLGCAFGIFAMVPSWWRHRRMARTHTRRADDRAAASPAPSGEVVPPYPPRDGL